MKFREEPKFRILFKKPIGISFFGFFLEGVGDFILNRFKCIQKCNLRIDIRLWLVMIEP